MISKCFHSFSRSEKWNQNASRPRSRSENSREFLTILEKRDFTTELFCESQKRLLKQMACSSSRNHQHFDTLTIEKSESLFKGEASFLFADVTAGQLGLKEEEVADFQDDFTHLALASTTRGGLTTWRRTSTRLSTRTLMTWRANLRSSRSSFLCWYPRQ